MSRRRISRAGFTAWGFSGSGEPALDRILYQHALLGLRVQVVLRLTLTVFLVLVVALDPPAQLRAPIWAVVGAYLAWALASIAPARRAARRTLRWAWLALLVDLLALTAVAVLAARSDQTSWTSDVLLTGFAFIPMAAATQLRPAVCAAIAVPTTLVFLLTSAAARSANGEPWSSVLLHTLVIAGLGAGSILLSAVARSRVLTIATLARERSELLDDAVRIEARERRELAEALHDGALQFVLAARAEMDAVRRGEPVAIDRVDTALAQSGRLLRSTLAALNPAVLERHGLSTAITELARATESSSDLSILVDTAAWPDHPTAADALLFAAARELLGNVVRHARARHVEMTLEHADGQARLVVVDDGIGITDDDVSQQSLDARMANGHLGLASRRVRLAVAGGSLSVRPRTGSGTVAVATVPLEP
ncbi:sensor histidine kinase [Gordonia sp. DT30]|uniref:sensor histidine kinase n=1 Tax=Gordonia sp. DT30 TaxID=3416546 RepID=UPI003CEC8FAE